jgi:hypothetical protein
MDGGKERGHVVQELLDECDSYHVPMHNNTGQETKEVTHMHVETSGSNKVGEKRSNLDDERVSAETGKNRARGECVAGVTETLIGKNRARGECMASVTETTNGKNRVGGGQQQLEKTEQGMIVWLV